jgi:hypothetical protein
MTFSPELGFGAGRWAASRPAASGTTISATHEGLRGEAGALAALALSRRWSIFLEGNAMLARLGAPDGGQATLSSPRAYVRAGLGVRVTP